MINCKLLAIVDSRRGYLGSLRSDIEVRGVRRSERSEKGVKGVKKE